MSLIDKAVMNFVLIGDIHSQFSRFEQAVNYCLSTIENCHLILLGDAFDSRCEISNSVEVYKLIRELQEKNLATLLHSNHQWKLQRYLYGNNIKIDDALRKTLNDFENSDVDMSELKTWLESLPFALSFKDQNQQEYRCAHAYHSSKLLVPPKYNEIYKIHTVSKTMKEKLIYGIHHSEGKRLFWWETPSGHNWIRCSGHYHTLQINYKNKAIVLDSSCGDSHGLLSAYDVNSKSLYQF